MENIGSKSSCVRFTDTEYRKISRDSESARESIPRLLKGSYFRSGGGLKILVDRLSVKSLLGAIGRMGNNLNQIAKRLHTIDVASEELLSDINEKLGDFLKELRSIRRYLGGHCGCSQN